MSKVGKYQSKTSRFRGNGKGRHDEAQPEGRVGASAGGGGGVRDKYRIILRDIYIYACSGVPRFPSCFFPPSITVQHTVRLYRYYSQYRECSCPTDQNEEGEHKRAEPEASPLPVENAHRELSPPPASRLTAPWNGGRAAPATTAAVIFQPLSSANNSRCLPSYPTPLQLIN